ncbi:MAG: hypothetical protein NVSMB1_09450 [Polyangiales bacterium]
MGYLPGSHLWGVLIGSSAPPYRFYDLGVSKFVGGSIDAPAASSVKAKPAPALKTSALGVEMAKTAPVDFSPIAHPGRYLVVFDDGSRFGPIVVSDKAYADILPNVFRFLRAQRCGPAPTRGSLHESCHLHSSITDAKSNTHSGDAVPVDDGWNGRITDTMAAQNAVDVEGGFHDAGDYVKFVGTTAFTLAVDLLSLRDHGALLASPRLGNVRDDMRDELRWGLDWLVKMLGGSELYHQVSGAADHEYNGFRTPQSDTRAPLAAYAQRPVFRFARGRGRNLLGRASAAFALGSQVFADDARYAARLLELARRTYAEAKRADRARPQQSDPPDWYPEDSVDDDLSFSAVALAAATHDEAIRGEALAYLDALSPNPGTPLSWGDVDAMALLEGARLFPEESAERERLSEKLIALSEPIRTSSSTVKGPAGAFHYALPAFGNGSIGESLGATAVCLAARRVGGSDDCLEVARTQLHWLFGQNPFGISFMVGVGGEWPRNIHHALAQAAHLTLLGAIVGGPTSLKALRDDDALRPNIKRIASFSRWSTGELLYEDVASNYVVNEPAIDFTAPLVFVVTELLDAK